MLSLVLLPGMDGTGLLFEDFAATVRTHFHPIIVTYPNDPSLGYAELEAIARKALPQDEPFLLLGESMSGPIAISIAASHPAGLRGLILCATFARNPHPLLPLVTVILRPLPAVRVPHFIQNRNLFSRFVTEGLRAQMREVRKRVSAKTLKSRLEAVASIDVSSKLLEVTVPTLDLRATHDRVVSGASGDYIRKIHPGVDVADLDAPHLLLQAVPGAALAAIATFARNRINNSN
jgi:pimeloyl-ACP methyl ester carboxylesterase